MMVYIVQEYTDVCEWETHEIFAKMEDARKYLNTLTGLQRKYSMINTYKVKESFDPTEY